jgi:4-amino-4-deoxy-L-arabinose transferase-like glycosyltransferase
MMRRRDWLLLLTLGLLSAAIAAVFVASPGYMDAEYYFATARQLVQGNGLSEPFLWNYLDNPAGIPHPSHLYWMPAVSLLAAGGMALLGDSFRAAQAPFVLLAATLPLLTAWLSDHTYPSRRRAMLAGVLAALSGFYLPYLLTIDAFSLYLWLGALTLFALAAAVEVPRDRRWLLAGALAGLCHWTRADGVLMVLVGVAAVLMVPRARWRSAMLLVAGYLLVMFPWWARNVSEIGSPFPSGMSRAFWLTDYDDLFLFPASGLTPSRWLAQGAGEILGVRLQALASNLESLVVVSGLIFLTPLALWGGWRHRRDPIVRLHAIYLAALLLLMSIVFPFAGPRGGFFHSSVAAMPLVWILSAIGLEAFVEWGVRRRGWEADQAGRVFLLASIGLAALVTVSVYYQRVLAPTGGGIAWQANQARHAAIVQAFPVLQTTKLAVAANDPPGLHLAAGVLAVPIPDGGVERLLEAAARYDVGWVVLESDHPRDLAALYADPSGTAGLRLVGQAVSPGGQPVYLLEVLQAGEGG